MPAKKEERGAEIDSCSLKISEEKIKILLYAWEKVYTYGDAESMCTDGIILNRYRQEKSECTWTVRRYSYSFERRG